MSEVFNAKNLLFKAKPSPIPEFRWHESADLSELAGARHLDFNFKSLDAGKFSYPYHFHYSCEEVFVIFSGKAMLRTPEGFKELREGDVAFFETGPQGAHQLYNHTAQPCIYLDLGSKEETDVCAYPDSDKINILPYRQIYSAAAALDYLAGEEHVAEKWPEDIVRAPRQPEN